MKPNVYIITGAGLSAESGIPTFRTGDDALWDGVDIDKVCNIGTWKQNYETVHEFYNKMRENLANVEPNDAHLAIAKWQKQFADRVTVITTNVDDLLDRAGVKDTIYLHGKLTEMYNTKTRVVSEIGYDSYSMDCRDTKPNVIFFGECAPNYNILAGITEIMKREDVVIFIGMSFQVVGVYQCLPLRSPDPCVINVNPDTTSHDEYPFSISVIQNATDAVDYLDSFLGGYLNA